MKPDPENSKTLMAELELKLREEKDRYELLKSDSELGKYVAIQEVEKYKRDYVSFNGRMIRLEEDYKICRERESKDQEKIKGLLDEIERKELEFKNKYVDLKMESRNLECGNRRAMDEASEWKKKYVELEDKVSMLLDEIIRKDVEIKDLACAKKRVEDETDEWKNRYKELEARELRLVEEITQLKEKDREEFWSTPRKLFKRPVINIDEEFPKRTAESVQKSHSVDLLFTPEQRSNQIVVVDSDSEDNRGGDGIVDEVDRVTLSKIKKRKPTDLFDAAKEASGSQPSGSRKVAKSEAKGTCEKVSKVTDAQNIYFSTGNKAQQGWCTMVQGRCSVMAQNLSSTGNKAQQVTDTGRQSYCKRHYTGRVPSSEERRHAVEKAEKLKSNLKSCHPSFIRSMLISHVSGGFWFGLPYKFCKENLTTEKLKMVLEDERGSEYNVIYIGEKTALSGGWKGFAVAHNLEFGDALLFELCEPTSFKVYIIKATFESREEDSNDRTPEDYTFGTSSGAQQVQSKEQDIGLLSS